MIIIDIWYGDVYNSNTDTVSVCFYPNDCIYRGNIKRGGKYIGDFSGDNSVEIARRFNIKWND